MGVAAHLLRLFRETPSKRRLIRSLALGTKGGNRSVTSADGTMISMRRSGSGPPLVMVHGTLDGMNTFSFVEPALAEQHEVIVYDRRGRGGSSDAAEYSIEREVEDLLAVLGTCSEPAHVVGHSFGAAVAMKAALGGARMASLVLYEPPMNGDGIPADAPDDLDAAAANGRPDDAIRLLAIDLAGVSEDDLGIGMAIPPVRKMLREGALRAGREARALQQCDWTELPISGVPTLVLAGERSSSPVYPSASQRQSIADDIEVVTLPGQDHLAHSLDPFHFTDIILDFTATDRV